MWRFTVENTVISTLFIVALAIAALVRAKALGAIITIYYFFAHCVRVLVNHGVHFYSIWRLNRQLPGMKIRLVNLKHLIFGDVKYIQNKKTVEFSDSSNACK